ncbi:hypothetical protein ABKV19_022220 [Rosa sericea]
MPLRNPATVAVLFLFLLLIPSFASAATGGHVGGSLFKKFKSSSSSSSSWSSHSSRHYYAPPTYHSTPSPSSSSEYGGGATVIGFVIVLGVIVCVLAFYDYCTAAKKRNGNCAGVGKLSVVKLQVGLMGKARSLQRDLNRITETANTSTPKGLSYVLTGAMTALLRNLDHCISSYSSVIRKSKIEDAEECFKLFSLEEAAKFDEVTLANVNNFKKCSKSQSPNEIHKEYIVVTILVATDGEQKLPTISGTRDLKKAFHKLGAISSNKIMAVEVLWTPQQENDTLTERELLKGYPDLRGFYEEAYQERPYEDQQPFLGANVI